MVIKAPWTGGFAKSTQRCANLDVKDDFNCRQAAPPQPFGEEGEMRAVQVVEGVGHPAVLNVPAGVLSIPTAGSGDIKLSW